MNRLILTAVITLHPFGRLGVEDGLEGELTESRFDVTRRRSPISGEDVSPVSLTIDKQIFLAKLHQGIADRSISVRVVLHGLTDDVGNLVILAVINRLHGMQNTPLNRFETILNRRNSALKYHIGSIVQKPILVHACQVILHCITKSTLACHASVMLFY